MGLPFYILSVVFEKKPFRVCFGRDIGNMHLLRSLVCAFMMVVNSCTSPFHSENVVSATDSVTGA